MAFKKVASVRKYYKYAECKKGDVLINDGLYVGPEQGKFGVLHVFKQANGESVVLNSAGHLDWMLKEHATPGATRCIITYDGKITLTKGTMKGKESHQFELETDNEPGVKQTASAEVSVDDSADISL